MRGLHMAYWMIFTRDDGKWAPQFGDHEEECVRQEREDQYLRQPGYGYEGDNKYAAKDIKVIRFARVPSQAEVNAKAEELNQ